MAKEVSLKITYLQAPGTRKPTVEKLHQDIKEAGYGFFQKNPEYGPSFLLFSSGIKSGQLAGEIKKAPDKGLDAESITLLNDLNVKLKTFEEENPELFRDLGETYYEGVSQIEITEEIAEPGQYISLKPSADNTYYEFSPGPSLSQAGIDIGPAKEVASMALNRVLEPVKKKVVEAGVQAVKKAVVGTATKVGVQAAAQAAGTTVPIIGNIVAFIVTTLVTGIIDKALIAAKKRAKDVEDAVGGAIIASLQLLGLLGGILSATFSTILGMVIIIIISIPFTIAYILFIINSGAYLVPPSSSLIPGAIDSPYIDVLKEPNPEGPFENPPPDRTVTYTITVVAERGSLTNISFSYECRVIQRSGTSNCLAPSGITVNGTPYTGSFPPSPPALISPVDNYVLTYTMTYDSSHSDAAVTDSFRVTADTNEVSGTESVGSAAIIIGNPPILCPLPGKSVSPSLGSYTPGVETEGHGSTNYWNDMGSPYCRWGSPQGACWGPNQSVADVSGNPCYGASSNSYGPTCSFYGYAADIFGGVNEAVLAPSADGQSVTWSCYDAFRNPNAGRSYRCSSGIHTLILTHLNSGGASGNVTTGEQVGTLFPWGGNTHLHLEYIRSGRYERPEDYFCF